MLDNDKLINSLAAKSESNRKYFKEKNMFKDLAAILVVAVFIGLFVIAYPRVLIEIGKIMDDISYTVNNMISFESLT